MHGRALMHLELGPCPSSVWMGPTGRITNLGVPSTQVKKSPSPPPLYHAHLAHPVHIWEPACLSACPNPSPLAPPPCLAPTLSTPSTNTANPGIASGKVVSVSMCHSPSPMCTLSGCWPEGEGGGRGRWSASAV